MTTKTKSVAATAATAVVAAPKYRSDAQLREAGMDTLSARIRALHADGATTGEISRIVVRSNGEHPKYQHVRNVLNTPLKGKVATTAG